MLAAVFLSINACTIIDKTNQRSNKLPLEINYPPAIDVSYREVIDRLKDHIGINVRWGGQIIRNETLDDLTRLTIIAYPLSKQGQPDRNVNDNFESGRFIAEIRDYNDHERNHFITVYGQITGEITWRTSKQVKAIPVLSAIKSKKWSTADRSSLEPNNKKVLIN